MDTATLIIGAVAAVATLASVYYAWRAADAGRDAVTAGRDAVHEARLARADDDRRAKVAALGHAADLVGQVQQAWHDALHSDDRALTRGRETAGRLAVAIAATGLELPACQDLTTFPATSTPTPDLFDHALDEIHQRVAELER